MTHAQVGLAWLLAHAPQTLLIPQRRAPRGQPRRRRPRGDRRPVSASPETTDDHPTDSVVAASGRGPTSPTVLLGRSCCCSPWSRFSKGSRATRATRHRDGLGPEVCERSARSSHPALALPQRCGRRARQAGRSPENRDDRGRSIAKTARATKKADQPPARSRDERSRTGAGPIICSLPSMTGHEGAGPGGASRAPGHEYPDVVRVTGRASGAASGWEEDPMTRGPARSAAAPGEQHPQRRRRVILLAMVALLVSVAGALEFGLEIPVPWLAGSSGSSPSRPSPPRRRRRRDPGIPFHPNARHRTAARRAGQDQRPWWRTSSPTR